MPQSFKETQIRNWDIQQIKERLDYVNAFIDDEGRCNHRNAVELLQIAERAIKIVEEIQTPEEEEEGF